jgi:hypothetical protein
MAFNINDLKSQLTFGGAKASLFQVQITNPVNGVADIKVPFLVKAATIPASTLGTIEVPYFGRKIKIHGDRTFEPWTVNVINDEDFLIRNALENWMAAINSHQGNITAFNSASPLQYKSQAQITQFSKTGVPLRVYNFNGLFPVEIAPIEMNWEATDQIEEFSVTFQYDWWNVSGGITGDAGTRA